MLGTVLNFVSALAGPTSVALVSNNDDPSADRTALRKSDDHRYGAAGCLH